MTRNELRDGIRLAFSDVTPDIFDEIMMQIEQEETQEKSVVYTTVTEAVAEKPSKVGFSFGRMGRMVAAFAVCLLIGVGLVHIPKPGVLPAGGEAYVVYMEINPSVRMVFDEDYRLLEFEGVNADGKALEQRVNFDKSATLTEVIDMVVEDGKSQGYLNGKNDIYFTFVDGTQAHYDEWKEEFEDTVEKTVAEKRDVKVKVTYEERLEDPRSEKDAVEETTKKVEGENQGEAVSDDFSKTEDDEVKAEKQPEKAAEKSENAMEKAEKKTGNVVENSGQKVEHASDRALENEEKQVEKKAENQSEKAEKTQGKKSEKENGKPTEKTEEKSGKSEGNQGQKAEHSSDKALENEEKQVEKKAENQSKKTEKTQGKKSEIKENNGKNNP